MAVVLTCPQGHQWQSEPVGTTPGAVRQDHCPVCGALAHTLPPTEGSGISSSASATLSPGPVVASDLDLARVLLPPHGPDELGRLGNYRVLEVLGHGGM